MSEETKTSDALPGVYWLHTGALVYALGTVQLEGGHGVLLVGPSMESMPTGYAVVPAETFFGKVQQGGLSVDYASRSRAPAHAMPIQGQIRIYLDELRVLLEELHHRRAQVKELQARNTKYHDELVEARNALRTKKD